MTSIIVQNLIEKETEKILTRSAKSGNSWDITEINKYAKKIREIKNKREVEDGYFTQHGTLQPRTN